MSKFFKKLFGTLSHKPWEKEQMETDNYHQGKTFDISLQTSAVIVIWYEHSTFYFACDRIPL